MSISSAPCEETGRQSPHARFSRVNAFRVLSLPADVELRQIYRQQEQLFVLLELGERVRTKQFGLQALRNVSKEEILEAVQVLERAEDSLIEELFWVHEMDDLKDGQLPDVLSALRGTAAGNTTRGAVARHNLAVMHTILAQERADDWGLDHWNEALKTWKELMGDGLFWTFMEGRAVRIGCQDFDLGTMKAAVCRQLSSTLAEEMVRAVKSGNLKVAPVFASIALDHRSWLELDAALNFLEQQELKNGFVFLGALLDRLSGSTQEDEKAHILSRLVERKTELSQLAVAYGSIVRGLAGVTDGDLRSHDIHGKAPLPKFLKKARGAIVACVIAIVLMWVIGRETYTRTVGAEPTNSVVPTQGTGEADAPPEKSGDSPQSERDDIEQERTALAVILQSLDDRGRKLAAEDADMRKQKAYLASVTNSYTGQEVPGEGQTTYGEVSAKYNRRVEEYNTNLAALKRDYAAYNERFNSLKARMKSPMASDEKQEQ